MYLSGPWTLSVPVVILNVPGLSFRGLLSRALEILQCRIRAIHAMNPETRFFIALTFCCQKKISHVFAAAKQYKSQPNNLNQSGVVQGRYSLCDS